LPLWRSLPVDTQREKNDEKLFAAKNRRFEELCYRCFLGVKKNIEHELHELTRMQEENMINRPLFIMTEWDEEARVWVATSDDVPGLVTEESTVEALIEKLIIMVPELLELNGQDEQNKELAFEMLSRRFESVQCVGA